MRTNWLFLCPAARLNYVLGAGVVACFLFAGGAWSAPCVTPSSSSSSVQYHTVDSQTAALAVAEAVNCTGGVFSVDWVGSVIVPTVIAIGEGTVVNVTGGGGNRSGGSFSSASEEAAVVDGALSTRLFFVSPDAELHLENVILTGGIVGNDSQGGGAIYAKDSLVTMIYCTLVGNFHQPNGFVNGGGALLLENSTLNIYGVTTFSNNGAEKGGAICAAESSSITVIGEAVFLYNKASLYLQRAPASGDGGAVAVLSSSNMSILGKATFLFNAADFGGAVDVRGLLNVTGEVEFSGNEASKNGGAISTAGSAVKLGGRLSFFNNTAGNNGGAISMLNAGDVDVSPGEGWANFTFNSARGEGGAISVESSGTLSFGDGVIKFINNTCADSGGAMALLNSDELLVSGETKLVFVDNIAGESGGAIFAISMSQLVLNGGAEFISNEARMGGAVAVHSSGGGYSTNSGISGGISITNAGLTGLTFRRNTASEDGGAVLVSGGTVDLGDCIFEENAAGRSGGAVSISYTPTSLNNCTFYMNSATVGPAVSNVGVNSDEGPSAVKFVSNNLACGDGEFVDYTEPNIAESSANASSERYDIDCDGCIAWHLCVDCAVGDDRVPACVAVPEHTTSSESTGSVENLDLDPGYWRASNTSNTILECYGEDACQGGTDVNGYCADGYEGPYCAACQDGYSSGLAFTCNDCSAGRSQATNVIAIVVLVVLIFAAAMIIVHLLSVGANPCGGTRLSGGCFGKLKASVPFQSLKIAVVSWQIITQFSAVANVTYPDVYERFLAIVNLLNLDVSSFLATGCIISADFFDRLLVSTLMPIAALAVLACTYTVAMVRERGRTSSGGGVSQRGHDEKKANIREKHASIAFLVAFLVYGSISSTVFGTFACEEFDDGGTYLRADYSIRCDTARYRAFRAYAGFMVIVYPVGIPALFGWLLLRHRTVRGLHENPAAKPFAELWEPYRPKMYLYELVSYLRRILLTGIVVFIFPNTAAQIAVTFMMEFAFFVVSVFLLPYQRRSDSWLSHVSHVMVLVTIYLALLLKVEVSDERDDNQKLFAGVLVAAHCLMVLSVIAESLILAGQSMVKAASERSSPGHETSSVRESQGPVPGLPSCSSSSSESPPEWDHRESLGELSATNRLVLPCTATGSRPPQYPAPAYAGFERRSPPPQYDSSRRLNHR